MPLPLVDDLRDQLDTDRFGRALRGFDTIDSTNTEAAAWAQEGVPEGAVVVTEYQSEGRGRHGRAWNAQKGQNLMFSVLLRPRLDPDRLGLLTIAASVAVADAIEPFVTPRRAALKWPNDVLLEGRKTCGMLLESSFTGTQTTNVVVLGVGLNVNQIEFPEPLRNAATSLRLATGRMVPRAPLLAHVLEALEDRYDAVHDDAAPICTAFSNRLRSLHEHTTLRFTGTDQTISGIVRGVTEAGALQLETRDGVRVVHAGEVTTQ